MKDQNPVISQHANPEVKVTQNIKTPNLIFAVMTLTNILINLDHGILPACTTQLKQTFNMDQTELGFLGSIVYLGIVTMGTFAGQFYQRFNSKLISIISLIALEASLVFFVIEENKVLAYICRYLTGGCQVFLLVYYPVWIDKFGANKKTLWLTLLQVCVPVGIFIGYGMTSLIENLGGTFKYSFYIQIVLVAVFIIMFALIPKAKLDCKQKQHQEFQESFLGQLKIPLTENLMPSQQIFLDKKIKKKSKPAPYFKSMKKLARSKMYLVGTFTMSAVLFVSTGIQFWLTDYFVNVQHFDKVLVNVAYGVVSITGPTSGCGFGGFIVNKKGGYENPKTVYYLLMFSVIGIGSAVIIPFVDNFYVAATLLWLVLFFGGAMMPGLTGIMMVSVPPHLRAFGNSNGEIVKNIFGYLPAPFFYGWVNLIFADPKAGIKLIMFWGLWVPLLLGLGCIHRYRQLKNKSEKQIKKSLKEEIKQIDKSDEVNIGQISGMKKTITEQAADDDSSSSGQSPKRKPPKQIIHKQFVEDEALSPGQKPRVNKDDRSTDQNPGIDGMNGSFLS